MKVAGYDYTAFCQGIAERDGTGCYVKRLLVARRAAVIEQWRDGVELDGHAWVTGDLLGCDGRLDGHHLLPKQWLKREFPKGAAWDGDGWGPFSPGDLFVLAGGTGTVRGLGQLLNDSRNGILACRKHHDLLENARIVIARADLPESVEAFAAELGERAVARLERNFGMDRESV